MSEILKYLVESLDISEEDNINDNQLFETFFVDNSLFVLKTSIDDIDYLLNFESKDKDYWQYANQDLYKGLCRLKTLISLIKSKYLYCRANSIKQISINDITLFVLSSILYLKLLTLKGSIVYNLLDFSIIELIYNILIFITQTFTFKFGKLTSKTACYKQVYVEDDSYDSNENSLDDFASNSKQMSKNDEACKTILIDGKDQGCWLNFCQSVTTFLESWAALYNNNDDGDKFPTNKQNLVHLKPEILIKFGLNHVISLHKFMNHLIQTFSEAKIKGDRSLHLNIINQTDNLINQILWNYVFLTTLTDDCVTKSSHTEEASHRKRENLSFKLRLHVLMKLFYDDIIAIGKDRSIGKNAVDYIWKFFEKMNGKLIVSDVKGSSKHDMMAQTYLSSILVLCQNLVAAVPLQNHVNKRFQLECVKIIYERYLISDFRVKFIAWLAKLSRSSETYHCCNCADMLYHFLNEEDDVIAYVYNMEEKIYDQLSRDGEIGQNLTASPNTSLNYLHPLYFLRIILIGCLNDKSPNIRNKFLNCLSKYVDLYLVFDTNERKGLQMNKQIVKELFSSNIEEIIDEMKISGLVENIPDGINSAEQPLAPPPPQPCLPIHMPSEPPDINSSQLSCQLEIADNGVEKNETPDLNKTLTEKLIEEYLISNPIIIYEKEKEQSSVKLKGDVDLKGKCRVDDTNDMEDDELSTISHGSNSNGDLEQQLDEISSVSLTEQSNLRSKYPSFLELSSKSGMFPFPLTNNHELVKYSSSSSLQQVDYPRISIRHVMALLAIRISSEPVAYVRRMAIEIFEKIFESFLRVPKTDNCAIEEDEKINIMIIRVLRSLIDEYHLIPYLFDACLNDKTVMVRKQALTTLTKFIIITDTDQPNRYPGGLLKQPSSGSLDNVNQIKITTEWLKTLILCCSASSQTLSIGLNERAYGIFETYFLDPLIMANSPTCQIKFSWKLTKMLCEIIYGCPPLTPDKTNGDLIPRKPNSSFLMPTDLSPWLPLFKTILARYVSTRPKNIYLDDDDDNSKNSYHHVKMSNLSVHARILFKLHGFLTNPKYHRQAWFLCSLLVQLKVDAFYEIIESTTSTTTTISYQADANSDPLMHKLFQTAINEYLILPIRHLLAKLYDPDPPKEPPVAIDFSNNQGEEEFLSLLKLREIFYSSEMTDNIGWILPKFNKPLPQPLRLSIFEENYLVPILSCLTNFCSNFLALTIASIPTVDFPDQGKFKERLDLLVFYYKVVVVKICNGVLIRLVCSINNNNNASLTTFNNAAGEKLDFPIEETVQERPHLPIFNWFNLAFLHSLLSAYKFLTTLFASTFKALNQSDISSIYPTHLKTILELYEKEDSLRTIKFILFYNLNFIKTHIHRDKLDCVDSLDLDTLIIQALHVMGEIVTMYPQLLDYELYLFVFDLVFTREDHHGEDSLNQLLFDDEPMNIVEKGNDTSQLIKDYENRSDLSVPEERTLINDNNQEDKNVDNSSNNIVKIIETRINPSVKANAFIVLGKMCMLRESYAKKCLPAFIYELYNHTEDPALFRSELLPLRNNLSLILMDYVKKYPHLSDPYIITIISLTLKKTNVNSTSSLFNASPSTLVLASFSRFQSLSAVLELLRESYIQTTRPGILLKLFPLLADTDPRIKRMARTQFISALLLISNITSDSLKRESSVAQYGSGGSHHHISNKGKKNFFYSHFLDIVFYLNGLEPQSSLLIGGSQQRHRCRIHESPRGEIEEQTIVNLNLSTTASSNANTKSSGSFSETKNYSIYLGNKFETLLNDFASSHQQTPDFPESTEDRRHSNNDFRAINNYERNDLSLAGFSNFKKRCEIYEICLNYLKNDQKFLLTARLCSEIISPACDIMPYLNNNNNQFKDLSSTSKKSTLKLTLSQLDVFRNVVKDAFFILSCPAIQCTTTTWNSSNAIVALGKKDASKAIKMPAKNSSKNPRQRTHVSVVVEGGDDEDLAETADGDIDLTNITDDQNIEYTRKGLINEILKKNIGENILPVLSNFKRAILKYETQSPFLKYLKEYILYLTKTFQNEVDELFIDYMDLLDGIEYSSGNNGTPRKRLKS